MSLARSVVVRKCHANKKTIQGMVTAMEQSTSCGQSISDGRSPTTSRWNRARLWPTLRKRRIWHFTTPSLPRLCHPSPPPARKMWIHVSTATDDRIKQRHSPIITICIVSIKGFLGKASIVNTVMYVIIRLANIKASVSVFAFLQKPVLQFLLRNSSYNHQNK